MWGLQVAVGLGLVGLGIWARGTGRHDAEASLWWIPVMLGLASLSVSVVQRLRREWEGEVLVAAFVAIGLLLVFMGARSWKRRA